MVIVLPVSPPGDVSSFERLDLVGHGSVLCQLLFFFLLDKVVELIDGGSVIKWLPSRM